MLRAVITMLIVVLTGCAGVGATRNLAPGDLAALAGTWNGTVTPPSGGGGVMPSEATLTLSPSGDYVFQVGARTSRGKAEIKDGVLKLTSTSVSGGLTTDPPTSSATLSERAGGLLVLTGFGHSDWGPFNFEVSRKK
jgi:hypothetical protein